MRVGDGLRKGNLETLVLSLFGCFLLKQRNGVKQMILGDAGGTISSCGGLIFNVLGFTFGRHSFKFLSFYHGF